MKFTAYEFKRHRLKRVAFKQARDGNNMKVRWTVCSKWGNQTVFNISFSTVLSKWGRCLGGSYTVAQWPLV
jgi:hypothetical protein